MPCSISACAAIDERGSMTISVHPNRSKTVGTLAHVGILTYHDSSTIYYSEVSTYLKRWRELKAREGVQLSWKHVKGHSLHQWNDRVDGLADEGRPSAP